MNLKLVEKWLNSLVTQIYFKVCRKYSNCYQYYFDLRTGLLSGSQGTSIVVYNAGDVTRLVDGIATLGRRRRVSGPKRVLLAAIAIIQMCFLNYRR